MHVDEFREYCLARKGVSESFPFDEHVLVFKVMGKMFALCNIDDYQSFNLKCDPEYAIELREAYPDLIRPGWHMSKKHWNTVSAEGLSAKLQKELIDQSYDLIVSSLPKKLKEELD
ncbi:MAG TPA: MmcQ/YjbR family DNA-binding protein [Cryomorphaceae bacterium]|nr:MmcQ/YjbR family DNA-binding protein [Cryomorphaceae bacterium]HKL40083.1 MmcQ/YjbR family DNA-binding protein [Cryomorphaceae bacterium]